MLRFLRPAHIVPCGELVWFVDERWPVAAAVEADATAAVVRWTGPDAAGGGPADRVVHGDGAGVVVQDGEQIAWVRSTGSTVHKVGPGLRLAAAEPEIAWLVDGTVVGPDDPGSEASQTRLPAGRIVALARDGTRRIVPTPTPVSAVQIAGSGVVVTLAQRPVVHPMGRGGWRYEYPRSRVRVDRDKLLRSGLTHGVAIPVEDAGPVTGRTGGWSWLESDSRLVRRYGVRAGGLLWWVGAPPEGDRIDRQVIVVGYDPITAKRLLRIDLGQGLARSARAVGEELWVAVVRRRFLPYALRDRGVDVLAISPQGTVRVIHHADSIDVSASAPALDRPADHQIDQHIDRVRRMFEHLDEYWRAPDGVARPLSDGLSDPSVSVEGEWPQVRVVINLRHPRRPGVLVRRTLSLFDDAGQPVDCEYADINLMEDLDTDCLAPAHEAVDGVLDT